MKRKYILLISLFISLLFISCEEGDNFQTRLEKERKERGVFLAENGITKENLLDEGIYYQELYTPKDLSKEKKIEIGDEVVIYYTGYFINGLVFDSNVLSGKFEPLTLRIANRLSAQTIEQGIPSGSVIEGWPPALLKMYEGTKARIVVPSNRAYGVLGTAGIPGFTSLVFEIEVQTVRKAR